MRNVMMCTEGLRLIAAVGKRGQLGLGGKLPWRDPEDMKWFMQNTMASVLIIGHSTFQHIKELNNRTVIIATREESTLSILARATRAAINKEQIKLYARRGLIPINTSSLPVWLAGGANTYQRFMPWVRQSLITHVDYDGPADVFMPQLWSNVQ